MRSMAITVQWMIVVLITVSISAKELRPAKTCDFYDTIPLNGSTLGDNNTLVHNNLTYNADQWGEYDYVKKRSGNIPIDTHRRGCICQVTACIRLCCQWGHVFDNDLEACVRLADGEPFRVLINVTDNGRTFSENLADHHDYAHRFIYEAGHCEFLSTGNLLDENTLFKDGRVLQRYMDTSQIFDHSKYCIDVHADGSTEFQFCVHPDETDSITFDVNTVCK
jgi:G protein-coupled receptor Mth (Methuselah protein)